MLCVYFIYGMLHIIIYTGKTFKNMPLKCERFYFPFIYSLHLFISKQWSKSWGGYQFIGAMWVTQQYIYNTKTLILYVCIFIPEIQLKCYNQFNNTLYLEFLLSEVPNFIKGSWARAIFFLIYGIFNRKFNICFWHTFLCQSEYINKHSYIIFQLVCVKNNKHS